MGLALFCVGGAALGAPQARFAWQAKHFKHLHRGGSLATSDACPRIVLRGRRSTWSSSGSFCAAGAALGALQVCFAWHAQHLDFLRIAMHFFKAQTDCLFLGFLRRLVGSSGDGC